MSQLYSFGNLEIMEDASSQVRFEEALVSMPQLPIKR